MSRKRAKAKLQKALVRRVDAQDEEEMIREQARLLRRASVVLAGEGLDLPAVLDAAAASADVIPRAPSDTKVSPRGNPNPVYGNGTSIPSAFWVIDVDPEDLVRRSQRWIPAMGHRRRVGRMPASVPFHIWDAYKSLDEFVYMASLSDEEIAALPLEHEFGEFYRSVDGEAPILPEGFVWDEERNLVDLRPSEI